MIEKLFIPQNLAQLLNDNGFNEPCLAFYTKHPIQNDVPNQYTKIEADKLVMVFQGIHYFGETVYVEDINTTNSKETFQLPAPTYQQVLDWLEEKGIYINLFDEFNKWILMIHYYDKDGNKKEIWKYKGTYDNKYEALNIGIEKSLNVVLKEKNGEKDLNPQLRDKPCPNCNEMAKECACMRNLCMYCNEPIGNITFTVCDKCWNNGFPPKI
jgi:hypothetical protein